MKYRNLGNTGLKVSEIGLGAEWLERHNAEEVKAVIDCCEEQGLDAFQGFRQLAEAFAEQNDNVAAHKTGKQRAQESGVHVAASGICKGTAHLRHKSAYKTDGQTGTVRNAHGDVTGQNRKHHAEGLLPDGL